MKAPARVRLAWLIWGLCVGLSTGAVLLSHAIGSAGFESERNFRFDGVVGVVFPLLGALIVSRRPDNRLAWLMAAIGASAAIGAFAPEYAQYAKDVGELPGGPVATWIGGWIWVPFIGLVPTFLLLLYPSGHLPSPRWRPIAWLSALGIAGGSLGLAFYPYGAGGNESGANPYPIDALAPFTRALSIVSGVAVALAVIASIYSLFWRRKRSSQIEKKQLKWFAYAALLMPVAFALPDALMETSELFIDPAVIAFLLPPVAMALAIVRYRLYDIDVLINRTLVYGLLTGILAGGYLGTVVALQAVLPTEGNDIAVVVSTLAVAALFRPLQIRVQRFIDRRFYRSRYDASATLDRFSARLRDQVDLDSLHRELVDVVAVTMQPAHASLWLREDPT